MKRWNITQMLEIGKKLFASIHRRKCHSHPNHEIHFIAREITEWLPQGIQSLINGTYDPRCLKRYYLPDDGGAARKTVNIVRKKITDG